ncbi:hypothetical protein MMC31_001838 [Peltigera leucophlebia]|nr:hypothetical protein [Peltigera leucophlebia]
MERKNAIRSLQEVWLSRRQIEKEIKGIKSWLKKLIYAQAKQGLTDKQQAQIGDLGLESSPVEQGSLLSRFRPSNCQLTAGLHGTSTGYLRQPRFGHKVELIDLTNDYSSEHGSICASHTRPSPIIQIKNKRIRPPNRQPTQQPTRQPYAPERRTILSNLQLDQYKYQVPATTNTPRLLPPKLLKVTVLGPMVNMTAFLLILVKMTVGASTPHTKMNVKITYEYERKLVLDEDYEAKRKLIRAHAGKDEPTLAQEFERKTISACELVQGPPPALAPSTPASASQKSKSNPPNKQERLALAAKDPECQAPNPDTSCEKVQIVQIVQEVDKPRFRSLSPAFNEPTNSGPAIPLPSNT